MTRCGFVDVVDGVKRTCTEPWRHETRCGDGEVSWWHEPSHLRTGRKPYLCRAVEGCRNPKIEGEIGCREHRKP